MTEPKRLNWPAHLMSLPWRDLVHMWLLSYPGNGIEIVRLHSWAKRNAYLPSQMTRERRAEYYEWLFEQYSPRTAHKGRAAIATLFVWLNEVPREPSASERGIFPPAKSS